jgi:hypothetical protein
MSNQLVLWLNNYFTFGEYLFYIDYPCPVVSVRNRKPVYGEIGHTIMNLLVDFKNYQYTIPQVRGFTIHMKDKKTYLNIPRNRYHDVSSHGNHHIYCSSHKYVDDGLVILKIEKN